MEMTSAGEGWRARIGVVVPSINTAVEPFYSRAVPAGVTVHAARMYLAPQVTAEAVIQMDRTDGMRAVREAASCGADAIAYCCTASSVIGGPEYDRRLVHEMTEAAGVPAVTVTESILAGLRVLGAGKVVIASPYTEDIDAAEVTFFTQAGLTVVASHGMGIRDSVRLNEPEPGEIYRFARAAWDPAAEALVLTCANFRSHYAAAALEADLGVPVVTSTQAPLWRVLRLAGVKDPISGYGRLLTL